MSLPKKLVLVDADVAPSSSSSSSGSNLPEDYPVGSVPLLLSFPLGVPNDVDDMDIFIGAKGKGKKRKHVVRATLNGAEFKGDDTNKDHDYCKFALGVVTAGSKEMKIYRADHIFVLEPQLSQYIQTPEDNLEMTNMDRKKSLTEEFGSRKKKRALKAAESNRISSANIVGATAVEETMANEMEEVDPTVMLINAADEALEKNRGELLPPYDVTANDLEEAYPYDSFVPADLQAALKASYDSIRDPSSLRDVLRSEHDFETVRLSLSRLPILQEDSSEGSKSLKKAKKLHRSMMTKAILLQFMLRFYLKLLSSFDREGIREDIIRELGGGGGSGLVPPEVLEYVEENFCTKRNIRGKPGLCCSKSKLDKMLLHAMVLALHINDFTLNLTALAKDLKVPTTTLTVLAREMGCKVSKQEGSTDVAQLVLPLTFPQRRKPIQKKK